ncbi:hypothetical protein [Xylophilus ampelinus]|uniref:Secreted protein n=1 Tax=Xylophilus ampelinus TaxID=54067 RepID=A0A318SGF7_9BURK|nr:hypothetical protein [Xylophilus ampelinus]MCS4510459.1 hypothetical protein [Xylophilus ampelinus]PYE77914.1 hypothetical protein DFQ15_11158 [Xylophilus ampelinus]
MTVDKNLSRTGVLLTATLTAGMAHAGAGANVNACVYLTSKPSVPMTVNVTPGGSGTHCMHEKGHSATLTVSNAGVTCVSVGYVEAKASSSGGDLCATDKSKWPLSYAITGTAFSGSTQTQWHTGTRNNSIDLHSPSPGTNVCGQSSLCTSTSWTWNAGTQGPLYIIFQPGYNAK